MLPFDKRPKELHRRADVGPAVEDLYDAAGRDVTAELDRLQGGVGRQGRGLDNDAVARDERRGDLQAGECDGGVPGDKGADDTPGRMRANDFDLVVRVRDLVRERVLRLTGDVTFWGRGEGA